MNYTELRKLAERANGWIVDTVIPATEDAPCKLGQTIDGEFYPLISLDCEDYWRDSAPLASYISASSPDVVLALLDEVERLSTLADKWNLECDEMREDNKRLAGLLQQALDALELSRYDVNECLNVAIPLAGWERYDKRIAAFKDQLKKHDAAIEAIRKVIK